MSVQFLVILLLAAAVGVVAVYLRAMRKISVLPGQVALLARRSGGFETFGPGLHRYFDLSGARRTLTVRLGAQPLSGQQLDVISKDRFSFRVTLVPIIEVEDAQQFAAGAHSEMEIPGLPQFAQAANLYPDRLAPLLAQAVTTTIANASLEEFLDNPAERLADIKGGLADAVPGARLLELALTAVTLPPELRKMFTEVERAKREGLAGLERARAEQASLRALANAARNLADNPHLSQLRMLQVMENARGSKTFVLGPAEDSVKAQAATRAKD